MLIFNNSKLHKNHKGTRIKGSNYQNILFICVILSLEYKFDWTENV